MVPQKGGIRLSGTNLVRAADHNQRITLHAIRVNGALTRVELARITGLTTPTIANISRRLLADGMIEEAGQRRGGRGQPPTDLTINADACYTIGVNIDRDHITVVLVDFVGQTRARVSCEIAFALPEDVRALYQASITQMLRQAGVDPARLLGIGVALPDDLGLVELPGRPAAYAEWDGVDMAALFATPFDLPVFVENDAAAAAMGELQLGHGQRHPNFFYILISWALGGGLVIDGAYRRGAQGRSGELGFMTCDVGDGRREQVQTHVSLSGLSQWLKAADVSLSSVLSASDPEIVEPLVERWIDDAVEKLSEPLTAVNCLINPAVILIGGRLPRTHVDRFATRLNAAMRERPNPAPVVAPVIRAALSEDAPAVGAAILPLSHFLLPRRAALWAEAAPVEETMEA